MTNQQQPTTTKRIPCEVWSRVVGYLRPTSHWNAAKRREFDDRVTYEVEVVRDGS
jgi:ribonucleoside-triphosphate reductase